jgi:hypothetical protein
MPHDHCYAFATRVLTGGHVHVVRRRTNGWDGALTGGDLEPTIVTVERPGSAYTLGHTMVHQAVMEPEAVTLFVRGPRRKAASHAAEGFMPPKDTRPGPGRPGRRGRRVPLRDHHGVGADAGLRNPAPPHRLMLGSASRSRPASVPGPPRRQPPTTPPTSAPTRTMTWPSAPGLPRSPPPTSGPAKQTRDSAPCGPDGPGPTAPPCTP